MALKRHSATYWPIQLSELHTAEHTIGGALVPTSEISNDIFFPSRLIVIQPLLGVDLMHSLYCNTHNWNDSAAFRV